MAETPTPQRWARVEELVEAALALEPEDRSAFLDRSCADDPELRREVESLIGYADRAEGFLEAGAEPDATEPLSIPADDLPVSTSIGRYRLLEVLGEGGFGVVYLAEQREPVRRRVALKVVKPGMDSRAVVARFEAERQALALMDHANIAHVYDAGTTPPELGSRPYFVMELIDGLPVTEHCDRHRLGIESRLELFMRICDGLQHAHQRGIIHRDVKPTNILVDADGNPKIIDFGVAKALHAHLSDMTIFTASHQLIGTPAYMSPEQAEGGGESIDTRSDIYSLGVLLYELLTGAVPFGRETLRRAAIAEVQRIICREEPRKPSTWLSEFAERDEDPTSLDAVAQSRRTDPRTLLRSLRGDLDWVVMRCLEKDRDRRYASASELRAELDRFLHHAPVLAGPPSAAYRLRKLVRRNRALAAATVAIAATLVIATAVSVFFALREAHQRELAEAARNAAQERAEITQQINDFLNEDLLAAANPAESRAGTLLREVLDRASVGVETAFADRPAVEMSVRRTLGNAYCQLGLTKIASRHLSRALELAERIRGPQDLETMSIVLDLASSHASTTRIDEALELSGRVMATRRRLLGADDPATVEAEHVHATMLYETGEIERAREMLHRCLELATKDLGPDDRQTILLHQSLTKLYTHGLSDFDTAMTHARAGLEAARSGLGEAHPDTLESMELMAQLHQTRAEYDEAERLLLELVRVADDVYGAYSPTALGARMSLADLYREQLRRKESIELLTRVVELQTDFYGRDAAADALSALGDDLSLDRQLDRAIPMLEEALERQRRIYGDEHIRTLRTMNGLAVAYALAERRDESIPMYRELLAIQRRVYGPDVEHTVATQTNLVAALRDGGELEEALPLAIDAIPRWERIRGSEHVYTLVTVQSLAEIYLDLDRLDEAETQFRRAHDGLASFYETEDNIYVCRQKASLAEICRRQQRHDEAESLLLALVEARRRIHEPGDWKIAADEELLGRLYMEMGRYDDARRVLERSYDDVSSAAEPSRKRLRLIATALAELHEAWHDADPGDGHEVEAARWRERVETNRDPT